MTRREVLTRMSSRELTEWQAYEAVELFPAARMEAYMAQLAALIANAHRDAKARPTPYRIEEFLLFREPEPEPTPEQTAAKIAAVLGGLG